MDPDIITLCPINFLRRHSGVIKSPVRSLRVERLSSIGMGDLVDGWKLFMAFEWYSCSQWVSLYCLSQGPNRTVAIGMSFTAITSHHLRCR